MQAGQDRPAPKRATNLANTADILLLENLITQWHSFMETNRNTTQPHTAEPAGDGLFCSEAFLRHLLCVETKQKQVTCPWRGMRAAGAHDAQESWNAEGMETHHKCRPGRFRGEGVPSGRI